METSIEYIITSSFKGVYNNISTEKLNLIVEASTSIYLVGKWKISFYQGEEI
jgi:hypothetical protein